MSCSSYIFVPLYFLVPRQDYLLLGVFCFFSIAGVCSSLFYICLSELVALMCTLSVSRESIGSHSYEPSIFLNFHPFGFDMVIVPSS